MLIASKLGIPVATARGRRKWLESHFLEIFYFMNLKNLGLRRIDFFIATQKGLTNPIAKKLMNIKEVVSVGRSIGQPAIDLRVELIVKDNGQLLELLERVKGMDGVSDVIWSEIVRLVGKKGSVPPEIIEIL